MSRHSVKDPDAYVSCPFNDTHQVPASRLQRHIMRCEKQHAHLDLRHCPFNYCHLKPASEMRHHIEHCPDKSIVERDILARENGTEQDENRKMGHFTKIEYQDDWADEDTKYEDWDNKSERVEAPIAATAYERAQQATRLPRSQPKALHYMHQQHRLPSQSLPATGVGRGRGVLRSGNNESQVASVRTAKPIQNGFREGSSPISGLSEMHDTASCHSTETTTPNRGNGNGLGRGCARGRGLLSMRSSQSATPKVGMAANFDCNAPSLLVTAGRGRGRGLAVGHTGPQYVHSNSGEDRKKELRKWQKKEREIEELEARQRNCEKLGLDEVQKLERKEFILQQIESLSTLGGI